MLGERRSNRLARPLLGWRKDRSAMLLLASGTEVPALPGDTILSAMRRAGQNINSVCGEFAAAEASKAGWELNMDLSGHRLSDRRNQSVGVIYRSR